MERLTVHPLLPSRRLLSSTQEFNHASPPPAEFTLCMHAFLYSYPRHILLCRCILRSFRSIVSSLCSGTSGRVLQSDPMLRWQADVGPSVYRPVPYFVHARRPFPYFVNHGNSPTDARHPLPLTILDCSRVSFFARTVWHRN